MDLACPRCQAGTFAFRPDLYKKRRRAVGFFPVRQRVRSGLFARELMKASIARLSIIECHRLANWAPFHNLFPFHFPRSQTASNRRRPSKSRLLLEPQLLGLGAYGRFKIRILHSVTRNEPGIFGCASFERCHCFAAFQATAREHVPVRFHDRPIAHHEGHVNRMAHAVRVNVMAGNEHQHAIEIGARQQAAQSAPHRAGYFQFHGYPVSYFQALTPNAKGAVMSLRNHFAAENDAGGRTDLRARG